MAHLLIRSRMLSQTCVLVSALLAASCESSAETSEASEAGETSAGTITNLGEQFFVLGMPLGQTTTLSLLDAANVPWSLEVTTTGAAACPGGALETSLVLRVLTFER